jgi:glutaredoxin 3
MVCHGKNKNGSPCRRRCNDNLCYQHKKQQSYAKAPSARQKRSPPVKTPKVEIYSKSTCPYCVKAKALLTKNGLRYKEYEENTDAIRQEMIRRSGRKTVPQIFINGKHIGGYDDLSKILH